MATKISFSGTIQRVSPVLNRSNNRPAFRVSLKIKDTECETIISAAETAGIKWQKNSNGQEYLPVGPMNIHRDYTASYSVFNDNSYLAFAKEGDTFEAEGVFATKGDTVEFRKGKQVVKTTALYITRMSGEYVERITAKVLAAKQAELLKQLISAGSDTDENEADE